MVFLLERCFPLEIHGYGVKLLVFRGKLGLNGIFCFFVNIKGTSGYEDASFKPLCVKIGSAVSAVACLMESKK